MNQELPDVQAGFRKGRGTRGQIANIRWIIEKSKWVSEKHLLILCWLHQSLRLCGSQQTVENSSRDGNTRPPYLPPEKSVYMSRSNRIRHGTTDWFQIGERVCQVCILSPCWFSLYAEYIMRNAGLEEAQAGIKIARRNINNLRYADDTTLMAESEKLLVFPVVMYGCENWTINKTEHQRIDAFELWCWRRLLRVLGLQGDQTSQSER